MKQRPHADQKTEKPDKNRNGIDDTIEPDVPDISAGSRKLADRLRDNTNTSPDLSGGDIDAKWEDADSTGDEAVGGSTATPGQTDIDATGRAMGIEYQDGEPLKAGNREQDRDEERWELDPASSSDYPERAKEQAEKKDSNESS